MLKLNIKLVLSLRGKGTYMHNFIYYAVFFIAKLKNEQLLCEK